MTNIKKLSRKLLADAGLKRAAKKAAKEKAAKDADKDKE